MSQRYLKAFSRAIWDSDLIASRMLLAIAEFTWGAMLLWPGETFDRKPYEIMGRFASEEFWGILFLGFAVIQFYILVAERYHDAFSRVFAGVNSFFWCLSTYTIFLSVTPPPAAIGGNVALCIASIWIFARPYVLVERMHAHAKAAERSA